MLGGFCMLKLEKGFFDIAFHGQFNRTLGQVPGEVDADAPVAFPVGLHRVVITDVFLKCNASTLLMYLTPKPSTTRVKEMGLVL